MDCKYSAELQLRNLACVVPHLEASDLPASLTVAARIREAIATCPAQDQAPLLLQLDYLMAQLHTLRGRH